jgi:hypothetical protein
VDWKEIKKEWPPEDKDVLIWDGNYYNVAQLSWKEGENDEIPVFQTGCGCGNRDVILWSFLPDQPERSKREDSLCTNCFELEEAIGKCFSQEGICPKCGRIVRCGALNTMET